MEEIVDGVFMFIYSRLYNTGNRQHRNQMPRFEIRISSVLPLIIHLSIRFNAQMIFYQN